MQKTAFILGTRPEIIKLFPVILECQKREIPFFIVHTNQHYDPGMDSVFFSDFGLPEPKYNLEIGSGTHGTQIGRMMMKIESVLFDDRPDVVVVQGDTNTVLAGALVASRLGIKVAHVEAGLRSYDRTMPEEINRITTDHVADFLFCPTEKQRDILLGEGIPETKITVTGNTIVDAVDASVGLAEERSTILETLGIENDSYLFLTCHRPDNTDQEEHFSSIMNGVSALASKHGLACVFPLHPRLKSRKAEIERLPGMRVIEPVNYLDSIILQRHSRMVFTDSGGIQEEACILRKKCVVLRLNTERPETLAVGGAILLDTFSQDEIERCYDSLLSKDVTWSNPFGDGKAAHKILNTIIQGV